MVILIVNIRNTNNSSNSNRSSRSSYNDNTVMNNNSNNNNDNHGNSNSNNNQKLILEIMIISVMITMPLRINVQISIIVITYNGDCSHQNQHADLAWQNSAQTHAAPPKGTSGPLPGPHHRSPPAASSLGTPRRSSLRPTRAWAKSRVA